MFTKTSQQTTDPFKDLLTHEEEVELPKTDIEALDLLIESEAKLLKMLERLDVDETGAVVPGSPAPGGGNGMSSLPGSPTKQDPGSPGGGGDPNIKKAQTWTPFDNEDPEMHSFNIRINRRRQPGGKLGSGGGGGGGGGDDSASDLGIDLDMRGGSDEGDEGDDEDDVVPDRSQLKRKARKRLAVGMGSRGDNRKGGGHGGGDGGGGSGKGKGRSKKDQAEAARRMMGRGSPKKSDQTFLTTKPDLA